ncbi:HTH-type transcriptional regulator LeuO [Sinobacterium norvegicum]|uniref:HTH-type transcriptional regulator LeuO n=1 Tax=Sinobacterium norvegicum TaxID=1641715 RepID=A0ABM9ADB9_9GAMM|nr:LysR family transcriptional regulator [Sinobacterium norvegicum]CAH0991203.1 HTH-type transcriptional regulator LeuO [Sinobacterium norvegicum]
MPKLKHLDLNLFRIFISVYRTRSFTRSAEELDLTQSSVSNAIGRLKRSLNSELFYREGRTTKATKVADELFAQLASSIIDIERVVNSLEAFDPKTSARTFIVYAYDSAIHMALPQIKQAIADTNIDIVFKQLPADDQQVYHDIENETVDLLLDIFVPPQPSLNNLKIHSSDMCCLVRKNHPRITDSISIEQFEAEQHVLLSHRRFNLTLADYFILQRLDARPTYCEHSSEFSILATVSECDAIAILPRGLVEKHQDKFGVRAIDIPYKTRPIELNMIWAKKFDQAPAHRWLRETIENVAKLI